LHRISGSAAAMGGLDGTAALAWFETIAIAEENPLIQLRITGCRK